MQLFLTEAVVILNLIDITIYDYVICWFMCSILALYRLGTIESCFVHVVQ